MTTPALDAFQVIAHPSRRQVLQMLSKESLTINALAENFDMSRLAVSKHLKIMHNAGFISNTDMAVNAIAPQSKTALTIAGFHQLL